VIKNTFGSSERFALRAYEPVRVIRLMLSNHPATKSIEIDKFLGDGKICDY